MAILKNAKLAVNVVASLAGTMSHQIMNAAVNEVILIFPSRRHAARLAVMFEDVRAIAVHPAIAARRKSRQPRADDDDGFFRHECLEFCSARESKHARACLFKQFVVE